jgi:hypothetical protein
VQWAISLVTALLDGDDSIIAQLVEEGGTSETSLLGLAALSVILLRLREASGGGQPQETLQAVGRFLAGAGESLDRSARFDLDIWLKGA